MRKHVYTIKAEDVYKPWLKVPGHTFMVTDVIGRILPRDEGKRVYEVDGIIQVESDEQLAARLQKSDEQANV